MACQHLTAPLQVALDMIGKRGIMRPGIQRDQRIQYAQDILQKELLPHIGIGPRGQVKKVGLTCSLLAVVASIPLPLAPAIAQHLLLTGILPWLHGAPYPAGRPASP